MWLGCGKVNGVPRINSNSQSQKARQSPATDGSRGGVSKGRGKRSKDNTGCTAIASHGERCGKSVVPGLTVCSVHGGGTRASVRKAKRTQSSKRMQQLWGLSTDTSSISIEQELNKVARNKLRDITALRVELGSNPSKYYGLLVDQYIEEETERGYTIRKVKRQKVHPLVDELHKAEQELNVVLRMLHELGSDSNADDVERIRLQTARETARLVKAFPGLGIDEAAAEVTKRV